MEVFQNYAGKLDGVVWLFPWGDMDRTLASIGPGGKDRYKPRFALVEVIDHFVPKYWQRISRVTPPQQDDFRKIQATAGDRRFFENMLAKRKERNLQAVRTVVAEAVRRGVPIVLGVTPYRKGDALEPLPPEAVSLLEEMAAAGATIFDASAVLAQAPAGIEACYLDLVHLSSEGHRLIGQALGAKIDEVIPRGPDARNPQLNADRTKPRA
jgi:hypothetical protein